MNQMDSKTFFYHVAEMRKFQKEHLRTRSTIASYKARQLENIIDVEIDRVMKIVGNDK